MTISLDRTVSADTRWYAGDFHAHSLFSDGVLTPAEILDQARAGGLDFMCATDHNTAAGHSDYGEPEDILVVPGVEVTLSQGHFNAFGAIDQSDAWLEELPRSVPALTHNDPGLEDYTPGSLIEELNTLGLRSSINHPMCRAWAWWDGATKLDDLSYLEVWNDPTWPDNGLGNRAALGMWTGLLNAGHRITAVGGSDFHNPDPMPYLDQGEIGGHRIHLPTTYIYAAGLSANALLEAAAEGRAYVSMGPEIDFTAEGDDDVVLVGDELGNGGQFGFTVNVKAPERMQVRLVSNGETVRHIDGAEVIEAEFEHTPETASGWYRIDVANEGGEILAFTNPIYHGPRLDKVGERVADFLDYEELEARELFPAIHF